MQGGAFFFLPCSYSYHAIDAMLLAEGLNDKTVQARAREGKQQRGRAPSNSHSMQIKCSKSVNQNSCHFHNHSIEQSED